MKLTNVITSLFGYLYLGYGPYLAHEKETFGGWDILLVVVASCFLIWFKGEAARDLIEKILPNIKK